VNELVGVDELDPDRARTIETDAIELDRVPVAEASTEGLDQPDEFAGPEEFADEPGAVDLDEAFKTAARQEGAEESEESEDAPEPDPDRQVVRLEEAAEALPAIARVAAGMWLRAAAWGVGTSLRVTARVARAATDPSAAAEFYADIGRGLREYAREFLGVTDLDDRVKQLTPLAGSSMRQSDARPELALRAQGEELLRKAADVGFEENAHPAYARILSELAPDEARILRVLAIDGPQAMVDVRASNLIGLGSQLIAGGLNMIGPAAGVRRRDHVPAYLNNLSRLGLIFLSDESLSDSVAYQVLEAQPDVLGLIKTTSRAKSIHRSIELTPFGRDFVDVCLPLDRPALPAGPPPLLMSGDSAADAD
jgi:abortive infection alpha-like protein